MIASYYGRKNLPIITAKGIKIRDASGCIKNQFTIVLWHIESTLEIESNQILKSTGIPTATGL